MRKILFLLIACFCLISVQAAYLKDIPMTLTQPDGSVLQCFASGDEYFNYLHDSNGYTIIQHPHTGWYVYAEKRDGKLVATEHVAGIQDPASLGLQPYALISPEEWLARREAWKEPEMPRKNRDFIPNHGTINNICIFIRFSNDSPLTNSYSDVDNMFNDVSDGAISLRSYFREASYGAIEIPTTFYPGHNGENILSYQDTYPRNYFKPYNESTNPDGYQTSDERREREFSMLERAVNYINENYPIPDDINLDYDEDGLVDNVCFIIRGGVGAWGSLLWPHKWSIQDRVVEMNGKRVYTYNLQLADAATYFNAAVMCHEMNHSLGAPDLYHYDYGTELAPVGKWDLMASTTMPPQHCGAYMKMKYGHWIDSIPEITEPGTYTLNPISSPTPTNVAYKIPSTTPNQFYVVEYRNNSFLYESGLPGSGLVIYRINTTFSGNADYNPDQGIYDEIYVYRPDGTPDSNGDPSQAFFTSDVGRTEFGASTNPPPFFTNGTIDDFLVIQNITSAGNTISFTLVNYAITAIARPTYGGQVFGAGAYTENSTCTLTAVTSPGYTFVNWTKDGVEVSTAEEFTFTVTESGHYIANFNPPICTINATANPTEGGTVTVENLITIDFETNDFSQGEFSNDDIYPWTITPYNNHTEGGSLCMKSGNNGFNNSESSIELTMVCPTNGQFKFACWASCESPTTYWDYGNFYIDGVLKTRFLDVTDWQEKTYIVSSGTHTFKWSYHKDEYVGKNDDCFYVDDIHFVPVGTGKAAYNMAVGTTCLIKAIANTDYTFTNWTENGSVVSTNPIISFQVTNNRNLVANFSPTIYHQVTATTDPEGSGIITGDNTYTHGESVTMSVTPNANYVFLNWTENGEIVSENPSFTFNITTDRNFVAHLEYYDFIDENDDIPVSIYPNPAYQTLSIKSGEPIETIEVLTPTGTLVRSQTGDSNNLELNIDDLPTGIYFIRLTSGKEVLTRTFVKK